MWVRDKREKLTNQLLMRGHATVDEILRASFGEWPPKGLDIMGKNNQMVLFVSNQEIMRNHFATLSPEERARQEKIEATGIGGRATMHGERAIAVNLSLVHGIQRVGTLAHEVTHIMQGDHGDRAGQTFTIGDAYRISGNSIEGLPIDRAALAVFDKYNDPQLIDGSQRQLSQRGEQPEDLAYYQKGIEIQARIQEIMIDGYQKWGRLPSNREELYVSLADAGVKLPPSIRQELDASPTIHQTCKIFNNKLKGQHPTAKDINLAQSSLSPKGQEVFWKGTIPLLYGDLIEMYGDRDGRARLDLGINERAAMRERSPVFSPQNPEAGISNNAKLIARQHWQSVNSPHDGAVIRADISDMTISQCRELRGALEANYIDGKIIFNGGQNKDYIQVNEADRPTLEKIIAADHCSKAKNTHQRLAQRARAGNNIRPSL